jgi:hypothetical protein
LNRAFVSGVADLSITLNFWAEVNKVISSSAANWISFLMAKAIDVN